MAPTRPGTPHESDPSPTAMTLTKKSAGAAAVTSRSALPEQPISQEVLLEKYAKGDENSIDAVRLRVARALAGGDNVAWTARRAFCLLAGEGRYPAFHSTD